MKKIGFLAFILALAMAGAAAQSKVSVAAASNISAVAPSLSAAFARRYPAFVAEFTFGASGNLVTQLLNGAPFQVFLSADTTFPQKLVDAGLTVGPAKVYAVGTLIFLTTRKLDLSKGMAILDDPSLRQVATCNPETAPYGLAAQEALIKSGLFDRVKSRLVIAQNVTQALQFTLAGADGGFVNKSALYSKELRPWDIEGRFWFAVDPRLHAPISQAFVVMKSGFPETAVRAFADFLLSPEAGAIFTAYGYGTP
ncbi:MAG: molybdate ABC transporter substrate-binding protein [Spirochaetota bacterium]